MTAFATIFGQPDAIDVLTRAYVAERLAHGLIFAGPVGVGKATTARALSKLFLCERPDGVLPCNRCASCRGMQSGNHPDYHVVTKELIRFHDKTGKSKGINLGIDVIRAELLEPAGRKATMGRGKVFVIEQADVMTAQAQNALLKTLEEPAGRSLIVLLTDQPDSLLATIRSRCQTVRFAALSGDIVARELHVRQIDPALGGRAAELTNGSLGLALRWIEDGVIAPANELTAQLDALFTGQAPDDLPGWFKRAADAYAEKQIARDPLGSKDQATREGLGLYLHIGAEHLRQHLARISDPADWRRACSVVDAIARAEGYLDANVNVALVFQQLATVFERIARSLPRVGTAY